ncbi:MULTISPECIES: hypothetical protein [Pseudomonas syringae group]|uniref:hypothetical protein n=1 Tax=Pseudomonas syringae group TaxID=136849 RepID=UPI0009B10665|nr:MULTISPECIES: hypothetical protein [Pseudomonas syringae group]ARA80319.1 hypothetical protein B5U27_09750 [Pseudomonas amygdali pv. lachrymans]MCK9715215.1 hypothetical protein [Pseudomonas syringae pv. syringae]MCK9761297.1 hypothetical protein [Pseudomonas syringae pv. syringae]
MMTKLRELERAKLDADWIDPAQVTEAKRKAVEAAWKENENAPIEVEKRLKANKAELKALMPYIKTLRKKPLWDEMQKQRPA